LLAAVLAVEAELAALLALVGALLA